MAQKGSEDGPSVWAPAGCVGDLDEAPGFWPWPGSVRTLMATRGVNLQLEDRALPLLLSLPPLSVALPFTINAFEKSFLTPYQ